MDIPERLSRSLVTGSMGMAVSDLCLRLAVPALQK